MGFGKEFNPAEMDAAAQQAEQELQGMNPEAIKVMAQWFKAHYMKAGHKRLGRILVQRA